MTAYIENNLEKIRIWIKESPDPATFKTNNDYMRVYSQIMNYTLYLIKVSVSLTKYEKRNEVGLTKHRAIISGLVVRIAKLYNGFIKHIVDREVELAAILSRLIFETEVKLDYLIHSKNKRKSIRSYILGSYKPEKAILLDLNSKLKARKLIPIENRIRSKILNRLKKDCITQKELLNNNIWDIDGKNFRQLLKDRNRDIQYSYIFGSMSHHVHGTWYEISLYHLENEKGHYYPNLKYGFPDPRLVGPLTCLILNSLIGFLKYAKTDPSNYVSEIIKSLQALLYGYDDYHEKFISQQN
jgi:hypothetical protein